jgi:hypothetical protein
MCAIEQSRAGRFEGLHSRAELLKRGHARMSTLRVKTNITPTQTSSPSVLAAADTIRTRRSLHSARRTLSARAGHFGTASSR